LDPDLHGWRCRPVSNAPEVTIEFEDARLHGFSGCNEYSAPYELGGPRLIVGPILATLIGCSGERDWVQGRLFKILEADPVATARGDGLRLVAAPEGVADFAAS
jgi:heat shock protein HslJ